MANVMRTFKYKLKLTKEQQNTVDTWIDTCRFIYNLTRETREFAISAQKNNENTKRVKQPSNFDFFYQIPLIRDENNFNTDFQKEMARKIKDVPSATIQTVIERCNKAYETFYDKLKTGEISKMKANYIEKCKERNWSIKYDKLNSIGYPKWANKFDYSSIGFKSIKQTEKNFILPKLGTVKVHKNRMPDGILKTAKITREIGEYYLCVSFQSETLDIYKVDESKEIALHTGIINLVTDSNEKFTENKRYTDKYAKELAIANRSLARKIKNSKQWELQKIKLAKIHKKIADSRKDYLNNVSLQIVKNNHKIVSEEFTIPKMVQQIGEKRNKTHRKRLSKSILDASWGTLTGMVKYKAELYEKVYEVEPAAYKSQTCNQCGYVDAENRKGQSFLCKNCGHCNNADINHVKNKNKRGLRLGALT